jgi:phosphoribosylaminoimidazole-succinocarboxamide synthase
MSQTINATNYNFPGQESIYRGKVREVYSLKNDIVVMIASDRISAFDHILPKGIPYKGQVLNQVATLFLDATKDIVPNWLLGTPDPSVAVGLKCEPIRVEMVIRGYLAGHSAREYALGKRELCGVKLPEGMKENDRFPDPIITPASKADEGHDEDISREEIIAQGIVPEEIYLQLEKYTRALFQRGTEMAAERGLILVDTKYEFGMKDGKVFLIDEIHTPDSSRYFYADGYEERQAKGEAQKQLSKEFVRQWLIEHDFQGLDGQKMPEMPDEFVNTITERYIELYEKIVGKPFVKADNSNIEKRIEENVVRFLTDNKLV